MRDEAAVERGLAKASAMMHERLVFKLARTLGGLISIKEWSYNRYCFNVKSCRVVLTQFLLL